MLTRNQKQNQANPPTEMAFWDNFKTGNRAFPLRNSHWGIVKNVKNCSNDMNPFSQFPAAI